MAPEFEEIHTRVGPGTPSGELFRRYWIPVEVSMNLQGERHLLPQLNLTDPDQEEVVYLDNHNNDPTKPSNPRRIRVLGEDLVLYRDASGKPGLLAENCAHRGTSLYHGRVEEDGIRCMYHGWKYDKDGNCLEVPAEPVGSRFKDTIRQRAYPCIEIPGMLNTNGPNGLIFAYMGPPDKMPPFPKYPPLFREDGIRHIGNGNHIGHYNFVKQLENVLDVWHREVAHGWFKNPGVVGSTHHGFEGQPATPIKYSETPWGGCYQVLLTTKKDGEFEYHDTHGIFPLIRWSQKDMQSMNWAVPIDDGFVRWFGVHFYPFGSNGEPTEYALGRLASKEPLDSGGNFYPGWIEEVGRWTNFDHPNRSSTVFEDGIAMGTQPRIHESRFSSTDAGTLLMRRLWVEQTELIKEGLDPIGIDYSHSDDLIVIPATRIGKLTWEEGMKLMGMSLDDRVARMQKIITRT